VNRIAHEHDLTDADLVERTKGGAAAAFGELVARYQDRVYNTCYRMCHNQADALDLTQGTFVRALEALPKFESRANFYTWLFRIALNLTISHRRSAARRATFSLDGARDGETPRRDPPGRPDDDPAAAPEQRELQARVAAALAQVDEEFRAAVVLKDIEGLDYAQIAEILDVPIGTVKSRIHRGRLALRDLLSDVRTALERA
jgi:RNA polymerase sigma-70 factor, ECF subfamily